MDKSNDERASEANYATVSMAIQFDANLAQLSKGCRMCGKNVIHLDGKCDVYMHAGVCNSNYGAEANTAQDSKRNSNVLFEDNDWRGPNLFHLPLKVTSNVFDDLDDDVEPVNVNATIHGETAIAVAAQAVVNDTDN